MANAVQYAINKVKQLIPKEVLHEAFVAPIERDDAWSRRHSSVISVDHVIREKVINQIVMPDINLQTGQRVLVPLTGLLQEYQPDMTMVIRIPKHLTRGQSITSPYAIVAGSPIGTLGGNVVTNAGSGTDLLDALSGITQSRGAIPMAQDGNIELIAENTILLRAPVRQNGFLYLDCLIANNNLLSNAPPAAHPCFAKLVEFAVKNYIYVNCTIPVDMGQISGGMTVGAFSQWLDRFSDANDNYEDQMKIWRKVFILTDPLSQDDHIKGVVGGLF